MIWYKVTAFHVFYEEKRKFLCTKRTLALIDDDPVYIVEKVEPAPKGTAKQMWKERKRSFKEHIKYKKLNTRTATRLKTLCLMKTSGYGKHWLLSKKRKKNFFEPAKDQLTNGKK